MFFKKFVLFSALIRAFFPPYAAANTPFKFGDRFYNLNLKSIEGKEQRLESFKGKVLLIVNTASKCGFTSQYKALQKIHEQYSSQSFSVLGFPSNDFGKQEPGSNEEIKKFCSLNFGVTFPMFARGSVSGPEKQSLFKMLTDEGDPALRGEIAWNFEKFLIDKNGTLRYRFSSSTTPENSKIQDAVNKLLAE